MQLCRILKDLIVLLCVHNEWPIIIIYVLLDIYVFQQQQH